MRRTWTIDEIRRAQQGLPTSRRQFLKGASAALGGAFMAPYLPRMARAEVGGELKMLAWENMPMQDYLEPWLKKNNVTLNIASVATQDDVQVQLVGNTPNVIDITSYNNGYSEFYGKELKIVSELDEAQIPNYNAEDIFEEFYKQAPWAWDGHLYAVPVIWGLNSIVYNPKLVPEPKQYSDLLKPEYKGLVTFADDTLATWPMFARVAGLGDKFPFVTPEELEAIFKAAEPYREQSKVFAGSIGDTINLFVNGEIGVLYCGWSGMPQETAKQNVETKAILPKEGGAIWSDAWFIPKTAVNRDTAHAYINELVGPEGQAAMAQVMACGTVNRKAVPLLDPVTKSYFDYTDLDAIFKDSPLQPIPPRESDQYATFDQWIAAWEQFRAGF